MLVYQIKITLKGTHPPVWRRLQVLSSVTLHMLHRILQVAMGWTDAHLYEFETANARFGAPDQLDDPLAEDRRDARRSRLEQVVPKTTGRFSYTYDFGDNWEHEILVEEPFEASPEARYPICLAGRRACPPEDCGGIHGYAHLLDVIRDPGHAEYADMTEWLGGAFDPDTFNMGAVNERLGRLGGRSRRRPAG